MEPSAGIISRDFLRISARVAPQHSQLARETLARIPATRWQLEWYLPWWLGNAFGLDDNIARQFVLSNVLGLASIRLYDDATDDTENFASAESARELAALLQRAALEMYQPHFVVTSPFWSCANALLCEWREATQRVNHLHFTNLETLHGLKHPETQTLTQLGAPLKISALAVCQLTAREKNFAALSELLDHALLANVMYDHAMDCDADLRGVRWNLFIATLSSLPQNRANEQAHRMCLARGWTQTEMPRAYFQEIHFHLARAAAFSCALNIPSLQNYFEELHNSIEQSYARVAQHYADNVTHITQKLFGKIYYGVPPSTEHST